MRDVDLGRIKATQTIGKLKYLEDAEKQSEVKKSLKKNDIHGEKCIFFLYPDNNTYQ